MADQPQDREDPPSTGFLPISIALTLLIAGLFALGAIPGVNCAATP